MFEGAKRSREARATVQGPAGGWPAMDTGELPAVVPRGPMTPVVLEAKFGAAYAFALAIPFVITLATREFYWGGVVAMVLLAGLLIAGFGWDVYRTVDGPGPLSLPRPLPRRAVGGVARRALFGLALRYLGPFVLIPLANAESTTFIGFAAGAWLGTAASMVWKVRVIAAAERRAGAVFLKSSVRWFDAGPFEGSESYFVDPPVEAADGEALTGARAPIGLGAAR